MSPLVEGSHDLSRAGVTHEKAPDDRGDDRDTTQGQRVDGGIIANGLEGQCAQEHGGDDGHRIGLKQVCSHASAIAHVVAHVIGDDCGVAWVVLGNTGIDFSHEVGSDVGTLGEDATAESCKD